MKKLFIIFLLLFTCNAYAAAPTRVYTYTSGETISSTEVTQNEDSVFNYLQAGVDTYADGTIINADIKSTANIQSDKLNLTSMAQNLKLNTGYSFENDGTTQFDGTVDLNAKLTADANEIEGSNFDINGGAIDGATLGAASAVTVTNMDCNGGSVDGTTVGAASASTGAFTTLQYSTSISDGTTAVTEWSTDGTLGDNVDTAIPTEKAVKTYADTKLAQFGSWAAATEGSTIQASTDCFITVVSNSDVEANDTSVIRTDTDNNASDGTIRSAMTAPDDDEIVSHSTVVKSGEYYLITNQNDSEWDSYIICFDG